MIKFNKQKEAKRERDNRNKKEKDFNKSENEYNNEYYNTLNKEKSQLKYDELFSFSKHLTQDKSSNHKKIIDGLKEKTNKAKPNNFSSTNAKTTRSYFDINEYEFEYEEPDKEVSSNDISINFDSFNKKDKKQCTTPKNKKKKEALILNDIPSPNFNISLDIINEAAKNISEIERKDRKRKYY